MMNNKSDNTTQAFWIAMGALSSFGFSMLSAAILSRYFSLSEYGTYKQIVYIYQTLLIIFSAGLPKVFSYFLPRTDPSKSRDTVRKIDTLLFFSGLFFFAFLFLFSDVIALFLNNTELSTGLKLFSPIPIFLLPSLGIEGIFSTYKKSNFVALYNLLTRTAMLVFIIAPVILFNGSYLHAIFGWLVSSIVTLLLSQYFKRIPLKNESYEISNLSYKDIYAYSLPIVMASIAGVAIKSADQFYISRYFGAEAFAIFSNGFTELPLVGMITAATSTVLMPLFSKLVYDKAETSLIVTLWRNALSKSAMLIYPIVIFFFFNAKNVVVFIYSSTYSGSAIYFQIIIILNLFNIIVFAPLLFAFGKTKFYANVHWVLAAIAWVGDYLSILIFRNPIAIAIFSVTLSIVKIFVFLYYVSKLIEVSFLDLFPYKKLLLLFAHSVLCMTLVKIPLTLLTINFNEFIRIIVSFALFLFIVLSSSRLFKLDYFSTISPIFKK